MSPDPRTPVLVGAGAVTGRDPDPTSAPDAVGLMERALVAAADDAGAPGLLGRIGWIAVPNGIWACTDPGRVLAERVGSPGARTVLAEIGVLQQTLLSRACTAIAAGEVDVAVVVGGEAKARAVAAARQGVPVLEEAGPIRPPDEFWQPATDILTDMEIERDLAVPAHQYALVESALAHAAGESPGAHRDRVAALWAAFARVAAHNPDAWDRAGWSADEIGRPGPGNRLVAFPYTKRLCSQWNVDQAAAVVLCSLERARAAGVPEERRVFPLAAGESNHMLALPARGDLHRWPAFGLAARAVLDAAGFGLDDVAHLDLYSCFPAAVQIQARELGLPLDRPGDRPLTVTGGMTFAGGPLNNYVVQALVALVRRLRDDAGSIGLSTSVSGMLTKPGIGLWSSSPPAGAFRCVEVTAAAADATPARPLAPDATGPASIVGATVLPAGGEPARVVAIVERADGARSVAVCDDADLARTATHDDPVGWRVRVTAPGRFRRSD
ncbi:MAG: hypothetical protein MUF83_02990 [Acidimicrobiales bacterium]|nr:hypothetical protein [Acidimicrobiales bacterium]